jgi:hypothetical protein
MTNIIVTEIDLTTKDFNHIRNFRFDLDNGKKQCHHSRTSYNAFAHASRSSLKNGKTAPCWRKNYRLYYCNEEDYAIELNKINNTLPLINLNSLWDFYRYIGYNYKTKKWEK